MKRQKGYALLIVMLLMVIAAMVELAISKEQTKRNANLKAIAWSRALQQVCSAADTYTTRKWETLSSATATPIPITSLVGIPPLTNDTLATLEGVTLHASITMLPAGCSLANFNCKADVRVWTGKLPGADSDSLALGSAIVRRIGDLAGISLATNPAVFVSRKGSRTDANPTGIAGAVLLRCGEVNAPTPETTLRGNEAMSGQLNAGGNDVSFPNAGTTVTQITETAGAACSDVNRFAMDGSGRYMYCNGSSWQPTAKQVTVEVTEDVFEFAN